jgi:hypothetical protein
LRLVFGDEQSRGMTSALITLTRAARASEWRPSAHLASKSVGSAPHRWIVAEVLVRSTWSAPIDSIVRTAAESAGMVTRQFAPSDALFREVLVARVPPWTRRVRVGAEHATAKCSVCASGGRF